MASDVQHEVASSDRNRQRTAAALSRLKLSPFGEIAIEGIHDGKTFQLLPLTSDRAEDLQLMSTLGRWRAGAQAWFPSIFPVTLEGTTRWYSKGLIEVDDRILFLIDVDGSPLGHVGLFRFDFELMECEIDNIVRGEPGWPGLIESAIRLMMAWGRSALEVATYTLKTTSDNQRALALYARLGFEETQRVALVQVHEKDRTEWLPVGVENDDPVARFEVQMKQGDSGSPIRLGQTTTPAAGH